MPTLESAAMPTTTWPLTAGQTIVVGSVTVSNDAQNVYVTYSLTATGATFGTLHLWVGDSLANAPKNDEGTVVPGHFPYQFDTAGGTSHTFTIPLTDLGIADVNTVCGKTYYVVAHAEVTLAGEAETTSQETAFGGDQAGEGARWWFYGSFPIYCPEPPPAPTPSPTTETAWGGSSAGQGDAWWFYFDTQGDATQPIYAGQKLTDGTVTWDGNALTIQLGSWSLEAVDEPVKVQGYAEVPASRPSAGLFTTYKGTELVIQGDGSRYYAVHLDVQIVDAA